MPFVLRWIILLLQDNNTTACTNYCFAQSFFGSTLKKYTTSLFHAFANYLKSQGWRVYFDGFMK